jgi:hypothetical protein
VSSLRFTACALRTDPRGPGLPVLSPDTQDADFDRPLVIDERAVDLTCAPA